MRQVRRAKRAADHTKSDAVKFVAFDDRHLGCISRVRRARVRGKIIFQPQAFRRQAAERAALGQHVFPQFTRRARVRIDARHADDGDGGIHKSE